MECNDASPCSTCAHYPPLYDHGPCIACYVYGEGNEPTMYERRIGLCPTTVKELVFELSKYDGNLPVSMFCSSDCGIAASSKIDVGLDADGMEVYLYGK